MSNNLIKFSLLFIFLSGVLVGCANAQTVDLSTDKAVIAELQKIVDAKRDEIGDKEDKNLEAKKKNAGKLEAKDVCIKRLEESANVIVIGFFADDLGCRFNGAFVDSRYFEKSDANLSKNALDALGWMTANRQEREKLAKLWVEKGLLAFSALTNPRFGAVLTEGGGIKVIVSRRFPSGVTSRHAPKIFVFDKDGGLLSASGN